MATITIKFIPNQFRRWLNACNALSRQAITERNNLPFRLAGGYVNELRRAISSGMYDGSYPPYSPRYLYWKRNVFKSNRNFWVLKSNLVRSLTAFKFGKGWIGGVPAGIMVSGTSWFGGGDSGAARDVAQYARWMEYGRRGQPPRPLFQPVLNDFRKYDAERIGLKSLRRIAKKWD